MNEPFSIVPPPELVEKWYDSIPGSSTDWKHQFADQAAQWGADAELNYCCDELSFWGSKGMAERLRSDRRPKPLSLKEQALSELNLTADPNGAELSRTQVELIRRALEQL